MNNNTPEIASEVYDWLMHSDFERLNAQQRAAVLRQMTAEEYAELRTSADIFTNNKPALPQINLKDKEELMQRFRKKHGNNIQLRGGHIWRAAAVIVLFIAGGLTVNTISQNSEGQSGIADSSMKHDSIYKTEEHKPAPSLLQDTVIFIQHTRDGIRRIFDTINATKHGTTSAIAAITEDVGKRYDIKDNTQLRRQETLM